MRRRERERERERRENEPAAGERNSCGGDKMRNLMFD